MSSNGGDNTVNIILANWVQAKACQSCRNGREEHQGCSNCIAVESWLLGGYVDDEEFLRLRLWVKSHAANVKLGKGQWRAIEEKMHIESARGASIPEIEYLEISADNTDYWENWQENLE
jgi:hypothetical protein